MRAFVVAVSLLLSAGLGIAQSLKIYTEVSSPWQGQGPKGEATGPVVDVVREIQKRVKNADLIQVVPWARGYAAIQSQPNVVLFLMVRTAERNELFQWVGPIVEGSYGLYVKADSTIALPDLEAAKKLGKVGVYLGDARDQLLTKAGFTNLERVTQNQMLVPMLMAGRIDALAGSDMGIASLLERSGHSVKDVKLALTFFRYQAWIAFSKGTPTATVKAWADALEAMRKSKTLDAIMKVAPTWAPPGPAITTF